MSSCCNNQEVIVQSHDAEIDFLLNKESQSQQRMAVCEICPELGLLNRCRQCGCFMNIKTRIYSSTCPLGKW